MAIARMVQHGQTNVSRAMPRVLLDRLPEWLQQQAQVAERHWLDTLANALEGHKAQYWADVEALATEACPPVALFENGRDWLHVGKDLRQVYGRVIRQAIATNDDEEVTSDSFDAARHASETFLHQCPTDKQHLILLGTAAYLYAQGPQNGEPVRDALIWQLGQQRETGGRESGIAQLMLNGLRQIGLLGDPMWTTTGAILYYQDAPQPRCSGVPVRLNGVWLNLLNATGKQQYTRMSDVPVAERDQAKARIADFVQERFRGMMLTTEVTDNDRVVTRTPHGNLFGYVQKDHELAAIRYDQWRIAWAHAIDGNVLAVLEPAI